MDSPSANAKQEAQSAPEVAAPATPEKEVFVFRARYYQTTGPCIQINDSLAMPVIDAFEVVEVLKGDFKAISIDVLAMTEGGSAYPKEMVEGNIYTLLLTPSESTTIQLQENQKKGYTFLWIDGDEIEEQEAAK